MPLIKNLRTNTSIILFPLDQSVSVAWSTSQTLNSIICRENTAASRLELNGMQPQKRNSPYKTNTKWLISIASARLFYCTESTANNGNENQIGYQTQSCMGYAFCGAQRAHRVLLQHDVASSLFNKTFEKYAEDGGFNWRRLNFDIRLLRIKSVNRHSSEQIERKRTH